MGLNFLKRVSSKTGGLNVSVTLGGVKAGWAVFKKIFGRKKPSLQQEWEQDYIDVLKEDRRKAQGN